MSGRHLKELEEAAERLKRIIGTEGYDALMGFLCEFEKARKHESVEDIVRAYQIVGIGREAL